MLMKNISIAFLLLTFSVRAEPDFELKYYPANMEAPAEYSEFRSIDEKLTELTLIDWPIGSQVKLEIHRPSRNSQTNETLTVDEKGTAMVLMKDKGYYPGETIICNCMTRDKKVNKAIYVIPNPLYDAKSDGSFIEVEVNSVDPFIGAITLNGFEEGEEFTFKSKSEHEKFEINQKCKGKTILAYSPEVIGVKGGNAEVEIIRKKNNEKYSVSVPWGLEVFKYYNYFDADKKIIPMIENPDFMKLRPDVVKYFQQKGKA